MLPARALPAGFFAPERGGMELPNHLTPEELSKEVGMDRDQVIRVCLEESIPIYQGKIDKTLFQAHLQAAGSAQSSNAA
jgi:hypothetical protein